MINKISLAIFLFSSIICTNVLSNEPDLKENNLELQFICDDLFPTYNQLVNAYCTSDVSNKIEEKCANISLFEPHCKVSVENKSKLLISLSMESNVDSNKTEKTLQQVSKLNVNEKNYSDDIDLPEDISDLLKNSKAFEETIRNDSPSLINTGIKCVNSLKNTWHCGFTSVSHSRHDLSIVNKELRARLDMELLKRAEASTSKI